MPYPTKFPVLTPYEADIFERFFAWKIRKMVGYAFHSVQLEGNKRLPVVAAGRRMIEKGLLTCHQSCVWYPTDLGKALALGWRTFETAGAAYSPAAWKKIESGEAKIRTHAVWNTGVPVCKKIKPDHLMDDDSLISCQLPTCPTCLRILKLKPV